MAETKRRTPKTIITKAEAAKLLGRSEIAIYRLVQKRKIPFYKPAGVICFDPQELLEWAAQSYNPVETDE